MKTISEKIMSSGNRRVTVELSADEKLLAIRDCMHYRLGYPVEDIIEAYILADCVPVTWCSIEQKWID